MGRTAVVTGGASGIGRACCEHLARHGHDVSVLDLDGELAAKAAVEIDGHGGRVFAHQVDVSDRASVDVALDATRGQLGPIEILVTSAGISRFEPFLEISLESWRQVIDVNLTGTFHCAQAVLPEMVEAGWGRIVTISSSGAQSGAPKMGHYVASKGGVIALTRTLAREFGRHGITVNTIPPSNIETPMSEKARAAGNLLEPEQMAARTPVGRVGTGDDIAAACAFLCSDEAGYITGQIIGVNGGLVIG